MLTKIYGRTGHAVSAVGFGGMRFDLQQPEADNVALVRYAFDQGVTYFDTAPGYCDDKSETIMGKAFAEMAGQRERFFVSTKGMPVTFDTADKAIEAVKASLNVLQVETIDFYHIWCIRRPEQYDLAMRPGGQYEGLLKCREQGLIRHIVLSSHLQGERLTPILEDGKVEGVLLGVNLLNFPYRWSAVTRAHELGLGVAAMNPLAGGTIPQHEDKLGFLAEPGETPTEAALRFCLSCPQITVTLNGFSRREHVDVACRVAGRSQPFTAADIERIRRQLSEKMDALCTACGYCLAACPQGIPISAYLQYYNNKLLGVNDEEKLIRQMKGALEWGYLVDRPGEAADCTRCGRCEQACTQHLDIMARLAELARWQKQALAENNQNQDDEE